MPDLFFKEFLGSLAVFLTIFGFGRYFLSALRNEIQPHICTWIIWSITNFVIFFAQLSNNAGAGSWATFASGLISLTIVILCYHKKHHLDVERKDFIVLFFSIIGLIFWFFTGNALYAVIIFSIVDILAYLPTIKKAFYKPFYEHIFGFLMCVIKHIISLICLSEYSPITVLFQIVDIICNTFLISLILLRRKKLS